jgi:endonuclease YncB( thermonuclease family)/thiol-disulfide isomerase/thioredoxin
MRRIPTIAFLLLLLAPVSVRAAGLAGLVSEVRNGKSLIAVSANRKLEVLLEGVDAPEPGQEYSDIARQHLADLVLGKEIHIDYASIRVGGGLIARVFCKDMDVGLQIIRDGVAWYDRKSENTLTEMERRIYAESEDAARNERRGMWENGSPMPPWEWRRVQTASANIRSSTASNNNRAGRKGLRPEDVVFSRNRTFPGKSVDRNPGSTNRGLAKRSVGSPKPSQKPLNNPGEDFDYQPYLTQGRITVVYFYADWCPSCRRFSPIMDMVNAKFPDMQVLFINIRDWDSPVSQIHGIGFVPYLKIYDENGRPVAEGKAAMGWLRQAVLERER